MSGQNVIRLGEDNHSGSMPEPLVIGDLVVRKPVIQGGMGVGISLSSLAGAVPVRRSDRKAHV